MRRTTTEHIEVVKMACTSAKCTHEWVTPLDILARKRRFIKHGGFYVTCPECKVKSSLKLIPDSKEYQLEEIKGREKEGSNE